MPRQTSTPRLYALSPHSTYMSIRPLPNDHVTYLPPNAGPLTTPHALLVPFLVELVAAGLQSGLVPSDALRRGVDALTQLRAFATTHTLDAKDQGYIEKLTLAAMRSHGAESGFVLATRACEAWRLIGQWKNSMVAHEEKEGKLRLGRGGEERKRPQRPQRRG